MERLRQFSRSRLWSFCKFSIPSRLFKPSEEILRNSRAVRVEIKEVDLMQSIPPSSSFFRFLHFETCERLSSESNFVQLKRDNSAKSLNSLIASIFSNSSR